MPRATWIAGNLRRAGLVVEEHPGWKTRGSSSFNPRGVVCHHTASRGGRNAPSLNIVVNGRSGLPGPLCHVLLARDGTCIIIAAGRAHHAGRGGYRGLTGNSSMFGIEAENDGLGEPWTDAQLEAYPRVVAALLAGIERNASWCCGHREWAPSRKTDPRGIDMDDLRNQVGAVLAGEVVAPSRSSGTSVATLGRGDAGPAVADWQRDLNTLGADLAVDGDFGPATESATRQFQQRAGITADGLVGPVTRAAMAAALAAGEPEAAGEPPGGRVLGRGDAGPAVADWQRDLNTLGADLAVDGDFGPATESATRQFQQRAGITADGLVGPVTRAAMAEELAGNAEVTAARSVPETG